MHLNQTLLLFEYGGLRKDWIWGHKMLSCKTSGMYLSRLIKITSELNATKMMISSSMFSSLHRLETGATCEHI